MGNKNSIPVQILETIPGLGLGIALLHVAKANYTECLRASVMNMMATTYTALVGLTCWSANLSWKYIIILPSLAQSSAIIGAGLGAYHRS